MNTCSTCDYSVPIEGNADGLLECRRHAIKVVGVGEGGEPISAFPVTEPSLWCGDWEYTADIRVVVS